MPTTGDNRPNPSFRHERPQSAPYGFLIGVSVSRHVVRFLGVGVVTMITRRRREKAHRPWTVVCRALHRLGVSVAFFRLLLVDNHD